jgi:phosphoserine phosphatase RsbU/P
MAVHEASIERRRRSGAAHLRTWTRGVGAPRPQGLGRTLACSEVWGGHGNTACSVALPGLRGWVYSAPIDLGRRGGDVHSLSVCDLGVFSRVTIADVSGHGHAVARVAGHLLGLMRRHLNEAEQGRLLSDLSQAMSAANRRTARAIYATAVVLGFDAERGMLVFTNAGHPPPLWYRAADRRWDWLWPPVLTPERVGLPLGLDLGGSYADRMIDLGKGDLVIGYTDGFTDWDGAVSLLDLARRLPVESPKAAGATLVGLVEACRRGTPVQDDETLIVLQRG